jgi:hypothetical protein
MLVDGVLIMGYHRSVRLCGGYDHLVIGNGIALAGLEGQFIGLHLEKELVFCRVVYEYWSVYGARERGVEGKKE